MRDYSQIDFYLNKLYSEIYPQPEDAGHTALAQKVIDHWCSRLTTCKTILDVGAGQGFCQPMFERWDIEYLGVAMGEDVVKAQEQNKDVVKMDFSFLNLETESFDLVFSRHSLEHSPMPLLSLMEWYRVSKQWLGLVVPAPEHYGYVGRNHYYVLNLEQWKNLLGVAGWNPMWIDEEKGPDEKTWEYWIFCEKKR